MSNQMIGIAGVFLLTLVLFVLLHWFLSLGRSKGGRYVKPMNLHRDRESPPKLADDNAWLLWSPDVDTRAGPPKSGFDDHPDPDPFSLG